MIKEWTCPRCSSKAAIPFDVDGTTSCFICGYINHVTVPSLTQAEPGIRTHQRKALVLENR